MSHRHSPSRGVRSLPALVLLAALATLGLGRLEPKASTATDPTVRALQGAPQGEASAPRRSRLQGWKYGERSDDTQVRADRAFAEKRWGEAAQLYDELVRRDPNQGENWFKLGVAWHAHGKLFRAIPAHERATEFEELRGTAFYNLGCAYALGARYDEAFDALEDAQRHGFDRLEQSCATDPDLEGLREHPDYDAWVQGLGTLGTAIGPPRDLDFLLGEWDVYDRDGRYLHTHRNFATSEGFLILEEHTVRNSVLGYTMSYFLPDQLRWKRVQIDGSGGVLELFGQPDGGAMRFAGKWIRPNGVQEVQRELFVPLSGGRVHQVIDLSPDGGRMWKNVGDLLHVRRGAPAPGTGWWSEVSTPRQGRRFDPDSRR